MLKRSLVTLAVLTPAAAFAAPIAPPTWVQSSLTPLATATAQSRTYQQWDQFGTATNPATAGTPSPAAPATFVVAGSTYNAAYNPNGTATAYDPTAATDGAFVTSGGNIYSFSAATSTRAVVPLPAVDGFGEAIHAQVSVLGTGLDTASFTANGVAISTLPSYSVIATTAGAGMGASTLYDVYFLLPDSASLTLDFTSAGSSSSLDMVAVDTRSTVPEPASLALLGLGAAGLLRRRR